MTSEKRGISATMGVLWSPIGLVLLTRAKSTSRNLYSRGNLRRRRRGSLVDFGHLGVPGRRLRGMRLAGAPVREPKRA